MSDRIPVRAGDPRPSRLPVASTMSVAPARLLAVALLGLAVFVFASCGGDSEQEPTPTPEPVTYRGVLIAPSLEKPDAVLTGTDDQPFDLRKETEGYLTLLFVGYTSCPDICPVHMVEISRVLESLPDEVVDRVKVVFVTADPERDTPEVLGKWLSYINPEFIGLTGTQEEVDAFQVALRLNPATRTDLGGGNYAVNHAAYVMAFTTDNLSHIVYPFGVTQDDWRFDIEQLALHGWQGEDH